MAYDGWVEFNDVELINLSRTAQLAQVLGIDTVWETPGDLQWIEDDLGGVGYDDITEAPWYTPGYPASAEFAGLVPLSIPALDDSTSSSTPVEYVTDGGNPGKSRYTSLSIVASVAIVASTERGAEYGKRWLDHVLRNTGSNMFCSGSDFTYFRYAGAGSPKAHRRNVRVTRGASVTRKSAGSCSATWLVTFTLTASDPFEYGEPVPAIEVLSLNEAAGDRVLSAGTITLVETGCPVYDYSPVYDPLYPALVPSPTAPNFYPEGWNISDGMTFDRAWTRIQAVDPTLLDVVPVIALRAETEARMVRVAFWSGSEDVDVQCNPLFSVVVSYLPSDVDFIIDGEQKASYVWDGVSAGVRRTDSLVYSPDARPVRWEGFTDLTEILVTLDLFSDSGGIEGDGLVELSLDLVQKSD